jgi:hypothetical protein
MLYLIGLLENNEISTAMISALSKNQEQTWLQHDQIVKQVGYRISLISNQLIHSRTSTALLTELATRERTAPIDQC